MYDKSIVEFPKTGNEVDDTNRIQRAINSSENEVLYFPKGTYFVSKTLKINNHCSLLLHSSAVIKATSEMDFVIEYNGTEKYKKLIVYDDNDEMYDNLNLFIRGGDIDGQGLASCLSLTNYQHFTLADISLHNGKKYGLYSASESKSVGAETTNVGFGYELIANNVYAKTNISGLSGNIGIYSNLSDCHYTDCVVVDYTVGMQMDGCSNRLTRCHVWGGIVKPLKKYSQKEWCELYYNRRSEKEGFCDQSKWAENNPPEMLIDSVSFKICGYGNNLSGCYADTGKTGYYISQTTFVTDCGAFNNFRMGMDGDTVINHKGGELYLLNCLFRKCTPTSVLYKGDKKHLHAINCETEGWEF